MNEEYLRPPQVDVDKALVIERSVQPHQLALYMDCMDNRPMSVRTEARDARDGCILSWVFIRCGGINPFEQIQKKKRKRIDKSAAVS